MAKRNRFAARWRGTLCAVAMVPGAMQCEWSQREGQPCVRANPGLHELLGEGDWSSWTCSPGKEEPQSCPGSLKTVELVLAHGGSLRGISSPSQPQMNWVKHAPNVLLTGKSPVNFGDLRVEDRGYYAFDTQTLKGRVRSGSIRIFTSFYRARCVHREDYGCGYASEDPSETIAMRLLDEQQEAAQSLLQEKGATPDGLMRLFARMGEGKVATRFEMSAKDVDRWRSFELSEEAIHSLQRSTQHKGHWFLSAHIESLDFSDKSKREWIFVDHVLNNSLMPELWPRLTLQVCATAAE